MGVTGSGKTFTMANVIANFDRPILVISHNKTLAAQLYEEFKELFPENASNISSVTTITISGSIHSAARYISKRTPRKMPTLTGCGFQRRQVFQQGGM